MNVLFDLQLFAMDYTLRSDRELRKSIRSNEKEIVRHEAKIANPSEFVTGWDSRNEEYKVGVVKYWEKELTNMRNQVKMAKREIERRKKK